MSELTEINQQVNIQEQQIGNLSAIMRNILAVSSSQRNNDDSNDDTNSTGNAYSSL